MRTVLIWWLGAALALIAMPVLAHQMQVALSTVTFKVQSGSIEVIHRFYTHDSEHALSVIAGKRVDIALDETVQQQFGRYVSDTFQLFDQDRKEIPLSLVGVELEGDIIWVYQEAPQPTQLSGLLVVNKALLDLVAGQVNTVNIECGEELSTLEFSGETRSSGVEIDFSACSESLQIHQSSSLAE